MNINGELSVNAKQEDVWKALNDPEVLKKATPGCEELVEEAPGQYKAKVRLGIAAVRGDYEADIAIVDKTEPDEYTLQMKANSKMGFVDAKALVRLNYDEPNTKIFYEGEAKVGGLIAGVGQRILSGVAKMIVKDFFKKMTAEITE